MSIANNVLVDAQTYTTQPEADAALKSWLEILEEPYKYSAQSLAVHTQVINQPLPPNGHFTLVRRGGKLIGHAVCLPEGPQRIFQVLTILVDPLLTKGCPTERVLEALGRISGLNAAQLQQLTGLSAATLGTALRYLSGAHKISMISVDSSKAGTRRYYYPILELTS